MKLTVFLNNVESMLEISGVGVNKLEKYGDIFIETVNKYVVENNIEVPERKYKNSREASALDSILYNMEPQNAPSKVKEDTRIVSYNLYKDGKSIDEIASLRGLKRTTIEGHLVKCFELGMDIDLEKDVHTQFEGIIYDAIDKLGFEKLRPLKDFLPEDVSYLDINYFVVKYKKNKSAILS